MIGGATYAYFSVTLFNNFGTRTITAEAGNAGSVTLNGTNANLTMDLTVADMRLMGHVPYYASSSGKTTTPTEVTIGTATVGSNNDTNYYKCSYTLNVTKSGTMYDAFTSNSNPTKGKDQIILTIDNREYDWYSEAFPTTINGTFIVKSESDYQIKAGLRIINDIVEQNAIAGTNINISLSVAANSLNCEVIPETILAKAATLTSTYPTKMTRYAGSVTDECSSSSCTTVDRAQNVYVFKSNDINNVIFSNYCWKAIRTTETEGLKLLYNGSIMESFEINKYSEDDFNVTNTASEPFTYNSANRSWTSTSHTIYGNNPITLGIKNAGDYILKYESVGDCFGAKVYKNDTLIESIDPTSPGYIVLNGLTTSDSIKVNYYRGTCSYEEGDSITFSLGLKGESLGNSCDNAYAKGINDTTYQYSSNTDSEAYVGYMYNKTTGTLREMLYGVTEEEVANATYGEGVYTEATTVNVNDSLLKSTTESWFHNNSNINEDKLEDAVYCNDRSLSSSANLDAELSSGSVTFASYDDRHPSTYLKCTNITDSFNTSNLKARTNYKVGFMTSLEYKLVWRIFDNETFWLGSPAMAFPQEGLVNYSYASGSRNYPSSTYYIRPVISLNKNVKLKSGDGSYSSPFIAE